MADHPRIAVVVVAGGKGERAGGADAVPKQYRLLAGQPVLARTLSGFLALDRIERVLPVIGADHASHYAGLGLSHTRLMPPVTGGATRQSSTLAGLEALASDPPDIVLIHDGARPFIEPEVIANVIAALEDADGALPVTLVTD